MIDNSLEAASKYSDHELEVIKNFTNARYLQELIQSPGWKVFLELKDIRLNQIKEQFMRAKVDKDALWAMQIRLQGLQDFWDVLLEGVSNAVAELNPESMQRILASTIINPADLDGELNLKEL